MQFDWSLSAFPQTPISDPPLSFSHAPHASHTAIANTTKVRHPGEVLPRSRHIEGVCSGPILRQCLATLPDVLSELLLGAQPQPTCHGVRTANFQSLAVDTIMPSKSHPSRSLPFSSRAEDPSAPALTAYLLSLISIKRSNLCVSAEIHTTYELLSLAEEVGDYICVLKTHADIIDDFSEKTIRGLQEISRRKHFLLFEDRKLGDMYVIPVFSLSYTDFRAGDTTCEVVCLDFAPRHWIVIFSSIGLEGMSSGMYPQSTILSGP